MQPLITYFKQTFIPRFKQIWNHKIQRWYIIGGGILFIVMISSFFTKEESAAVMYAEVMEDVFKISVVEQGEIRAAKATTVVTPRVGWSNMTLTYLIAEGTTVKEGDIVARFDGGEVMKRQQDAESELNILKADMEKTMANYRSNVSDAEANFKSQELAFELSKLQLERSKYDAEMERRSAFLKFQQDSISLTRARDGLASKKIVGNSEVSQLKLKIKQSENNLQKTVDDMNKLTVKAPISGLVVYEENWSTGRKIEKGSQLWPNQPIMQLPDLSSVQSTTNINEVDISRVKKDQEVVVRLDAFPQYSYKGKVVEVASVGKQKNNSSTAKVFDVVINILDQDSIMKPGMTTSNEIIIETIKLAKYIPIESVFEEDGKSFVFVKSAFGNKKVEVKLGPKNENHAVILEGLSKGDKVALSNPERAETENAGTKSAGYGND
jgi:RND family efflux transporter MFP subunit